ncbi:hypothetical protein ACA910_021219 [Epithemia clementina (nom. ined.)]
MGYVAPIFNHQEKQPSIRRQQRRRFTKNTEEKRRRSSSSSTLIRDTTTTTWPQQQATTQNWTTEVDRRRALNEDDKDDDSNHSEETNNTTPIRIHFVTSLLDKRRGESTEMDQFLENLESTYLPTAAAQWRRHLRVKHPVQGGYVIEVEPDVCGGIYLDQTTALLTTSSSSSTLLSIANVDLVILVSVQDELYNIDNPSEPEVVCHPGSGALAVASACSLDSTDDRPVIGFINWCYRPPTSSSSSSTNNTNTTTETTTATLQKAFLPPLNVPIRTVQPDLTGAALHEIGHVLGFAAWLYKYFRHDDGTPRTSRPFADNPSPVICADGQTTETMVWPSSNTLITVVDSTTNKRSFLIASPRVKKVVQNHINCPSLLGAELADEPTACVGSHWSERFFLGEIMSPALSSASQNVLSALTLALMEDTGWYRVDYQTAETPVFGLAAGCDFVQHDCIENDVVPKWGQGMFCQSPLRFDSATNALTLDSLQNSLDCDVSHQSWTVCDLWDVDNAPTGIFVSSNSSSSSSSSSTTMTIPEDTIRYFSNPSLVSLYPLTESCPLPLRPLGVDCIGDDKNKNTNNNNYPYTPFYPGEQFGSTSRCISASYQAPQSTSTSTSSWVKRPACLPIRCHEHMRKVILEIEGVGYICQYDGQVITLSSSASSSSDPTITQTQFTCPRFLAVCPELVGCPGSCSGRGTCVFGGSSTSSSSQCVCNTGEPQNPGCFPFYQPPPSTMSSPTQSPVVLVNPGTLRPTTISLETRNQEKGSSAPATIANTWTSTLLMAMTMMTISPILLLL